MCSTRKASSQNWEYKLNRSRKNLRVHSIYWSDKGWAQRGKNKSYISYLSCYWFYSKFSSTFYLEINAEKAKKLFAFLHLQGIQGFNVLHYLALVCFNAKDVFIVRIRRMGQQRERELRGAGERDSLWVRVRCVHALKYLFIILWQALRFIWLMHATRAEPIIHGCIVPATRSCVYTVCVLCVFCLLLCCACICFMQSGFLFASRFCLFMYKRDNAFNNGLTFCIALSNMSREYSRSTRISLCICPRHYSLSFIACYNTNTAL